MEMGYYIHPPGSVAKRSWLEEHAVNREHHAPASYRTEDGEAIVVCLVSNTMFDAAGIAYDDRELALFNNPSDGRPRVWYTVPVADILKIHPEYKEILT